MTQPITVRHPPASVAVCRPAPDTPRYPASPPLRLHSYLSAIQRLLGIPHFCALYVPSAAPAIVLLLPITTVLPVQPGVFGSTLA
jgi:hypothetical protein